MSQPQAPADPFVIRERKPRSRRSTFIALLAFAVAAMAILATPLQSYALGFLSIFESQHLAPLYLTPEDVREMRMFPNLGEYGVTRTVQQTQSSGFTSDFGAAARVAGFPLHSPGYLPAGLRPSGARTNVMSAGTTLFTFNRMRAMQTARAHGFALAPMPAGLDGSTLAFTIGPTAVTALGDGSTKTADPAAAITSQRVSMLFVVQSVAPKIASTGVSASTIENYVLAQPGISPRLAAEIRALGDPNTTLPIPIPLDQRYAVATSVHGLPAIAIGDNTGIGATLLWEERGILYAVGGTFPASEIASVADSMR